MGGGRCGQRTEQSAPFVGSEQGTNDAWARTVVKLVAGVAVAALGYVELEATWKFLGAKAHMHGIVFSIAEIKRLGTLAEGREQGVKIWHGAVVQIGRRGPDSVERAGFVLEHGAGIGRTKAVHLVAQIGGSRRYLCVVPALHGLLDDGGERDAKIGALYPQAVGHDNVALLHVFGLRGIRANVRNIDHVQV